MFKYRVIWFDDQHESLNIIKEKAFLNDIELVGFCNAKQGIEELERNIINYDAALIDGLFFSNPEQDGTPSSDRALLDVAMALERLATVKKLPWFILSGQLSFTKETNRYADGLKNNQVYDKLSNNDLNKLWNNIKYDAGRQIETQLRFTYHRVFEVCTEKYIGELAGHDLLNLLKAKDDIHIDNHFNAIRKIVEDLFTAFSKYRLLPLEFVTPAVALNESSKFLAGKAADGNPFIEKGYQHLEETHLPLLIASSLRSILSITQAGSHRSNIDLYVNTVKTPYLFRSVLFQLLDVLSWFKLYVDSNPKTENWIRIVNLVESIPESAEDSVMGKVININQQKGFAFFKPDAVGDNVFIPPHLVANHSLEDQMPVRVVTEEYIDNRTGESKTRVKRILNQ